MQFAEDLTESSQVCAGPRKYLLSDAWASADENNSSYSSTRALVDQAFAGPCKPRSDRTDELNNNSPPDTSQSGDGDQASDVEKEASRNDEEACEKPKSFEMTPPRFITSTTLSAPEGVGLQKSTNEADGPMSFNMLEVWSRPSHFKSRPSRPSQIIKRLVFASVAAKRKAARAATEFKENNRWITAAVILFVSLWLAVAIMCAVAYFNPGLPVNKGDFFHGSHECFAGSKHLSIKVGALPAAEVRFFDAVEVDRCISHLSATIEWSAKERQLVLKPVGWASNPCGFPMVGLDGLLDDQGDRYEGSSGRKRHVDDSADGENSSRSVGSQSSASQQRNRDDFDGNEDSTTSQNFDAVCGAFRTRKSETLTDDVSDSESEQIRTGPRSENEQAQSPSERDKRDDDTGSKTNSNTEESNT